MFHSVFLSVLLLYCIFHDFISLGQLRYIHTLLYRCPANIVRNCALTVCFLSLTSNDQCVKNPAFESCLACGKVTSDFASHTLYILKKSTRRCRHYITSHRYSPQSPNNIGVSQHFVKKNSVKDHAYNQHIGRLNTNDATDSTFH